MHSFLMVGQSNMAGRGFPKEVEPLKNSNVYVLRTGRWCPMYVPVNPDRPKAGISLSESFADAYEKKHGVKVGLVPSADGGTCLDQWAPGGVLFDNAVFQAKLAMRSSELVGILWHQGEGDCREERHPLYFEKCMHIMRTMREELGLPSVPIILGGLGDFLAERTVEPEHCLGNYTKVNDALARMAAELPRCRFVSAVGLSSNPDLLHFSAGSLREFGLRYFEAFEELGTVTDGKSYDGSAVEMSSMERL